MKQRYWDLCSLHSFASLLARVHGPVFTCVLCAFSRIKPALTYLNPFPHGCFVAEHYDEAPLVRGVKHVLDRESDQNTGIQESHVQLSRDIYGRKNVWGFYSLPGGRCQTVKLCYGVWLKYCFIFLLFKREALSKHHTPPDWIHGKATMQRVNRYTYFILLCLRSGSRDCRKSREIRRRRPNVSL